MESLAPIVQLDDEDRAALLRVARRTLEAYFEHGHAPQIEAPRPALLAPAGAFVTLRVGHALRGCIGTFDTEQPIVDVVSRMALAAAVSDPRFPALTPEELPHVSLEISVLGPRQPARPEDVIVGRHGVHLRRGSHRGVLLPQVATDHGWDREQFLAGTCRKAGLPADAWRDPSTEIEIFSAEIIEEPARPR